MSAQIKEKDLKAIEKIARDYGLTASEFCRAVVSQTKKYNSRHFRVCQREYNEILQKAKEKELSVTRYCEYACSVFLRQKKLDGIFAGYKLYGEVRSKRIAVLFKDREIEKKIIETAELCQIEIGALIRYCALTY